MGAKPIGTVSALAVGIAVVLATPLAAGAAGAVVEKDKASQDNQNRRVCRNLTPSGTRLIRRVCRTQAEWDSSADQTQEGVLKFQRDNATQYQRDDSMGPK